MARQKWLGVLVLAFLILATATAAVASRSSGEIYLPVTAGALPAPEDVCTIPGQKYESLFVTGPATSIPAAQHADLNLAVRGYEPASAALKLTVLGPVHDSRAPQLPGLFADRRTPVFSNAYQRYRWDWGCNCKTDTYSPWETTVLGMTVRPGEVIQAPDSGYDIGGGNDFLVLYAAPTRLTLHVGSDDGTKIGYTVHLEGVCVEPDLLALYEQRNAQGRERLPALRARQPLGRAISNEVRVAMRDSGHFLDPRSRNDWWQGR